MQIHNIPRRKNLKRPSARVARGGKRGTTAGRGQKGQKSRAGRRIRPAIRDLIQRLPKMRGTTNKKITEKYEAIPVARLAKIKDAVIDLQALKKASLVSKKTNKVKLIASKSLTEKLSVKGLKTSAGAKKQIESAGGSVA